MGDEGNFGHDSIQFICAAGTLRNAIRPFAWFCNIAPKAARVCYEKSAPTSEFSCASNEFGS
jgi:hypothetical protein